MSLSLAIITKDSARYVEKLLRAGRGFADEIVVAVDSSSADATEDVCRPYADRLFRLEPIGHIARALAWLNEQCSGDWILRLDDDELLSERLAAALPRLMQSREITHYWLRRRWVIGRDAARWIAEHPWSVDWQLRLFRNIPSIVRVPGQPHTSYVVQGGGQFCPDGSLYHLDFVYHDASHRREKVGRYERLAPGRGNARFYLVPDPAALETLPIPADDPPYAGVPTARRRPAGTLAIRDVSLGELRRSAMQDCEYTPDLFAAGLACSDLPRAMRPGEYYGVTVEVRNDSAVAWAPPQHGVPRIRVAYHWLRATGELYEAEGFRTDLPHALRPGEVTTLAATVLAPEEPGHFILQWDLVIEHVSWFSAQGWSGPQVEVQIVELSEPTTSAR